MFEKIKRVRDLHAIRRYRNIEGWLTPEEALALYRLARKVPRGGTIVEIGSWKGKSTYCLARGLREGRLYAIDPFDASGEAESAKIYENNKGETPLAVQFHDNMLSGGVLDRICTLAGPSRLYVDRFTRIHLLFIDGDHSIAGCHYDFDHFHHHVVPGGYVVFHDFDEGRQDLGPTHVVTHKIIHSDLFRPAGRYDSLWVAQKR